MPNSFAAHPINAIDSRAERTGKGVNDLAISCRGVARGNSVRTAKNRRTLEENKTKISFKLFCLDATRCCCCVFVVVVVVACVVVACVVVFAFVVVALRLSLCCCCCCCRLLVVCHVVLHFSRRFVGNFSSQVILLLLLSFLRIANCDEFVCYCRLRCDSRLDSRFAQ